MDYQRRFFDPPASTPLARERALNANDRAGGEGYVYTCEIVLAVNVAMAANRPLLVSGPPGSGKSSLAQSIATALKRSCVVEVITAATQAQDLKWRFDAVRRLHDASVVRAQDDGPGHKSRVDLDPENYVQPGVLWKAFEVGPTGQALVVLLDEIDKADPDVPNALLVALGASEFAFDLVQPPRVIRAREDRAPLVIVTTNDERELSRPFVRRCVSLTLREHTTEELVEIAQAQGLAGTTEDRAVAEALAAVVERLRGAARAEGEPPPSTAEYLDALRACLQLEVDPSSPVWPAIERATLRKRLDPDAETDAMEGPS